MARHIRWLIALTLLCIAAALFVPGIPQWPSYHQFADRRGALGIPNVLDVTSNIGFLIAGLAGLVVVFGGRAQFEFASERWPWPVFFFGMLLAGIGSAYYHLAPDNERLFWDRLPMAFTFMGLAASQIVDRVGARVGLASLVPLLFAGVVSVVYWRWTERAGAGNVVPYGILQGYAIVLLVSLATMAPSRYSRSGDLYWIFGWYVIAKVFEALDGHVFALGNLVSGHTLKHLAAAGSGLVACRMLERRTLRPRTAAVEEQAR